MREKRFFILMLAFLILLPGKVFAKSKGIEVVLDGQKIDFDVEPELKGGRTFVPMRKIFELLGMEVEFDKDNRRVLANKESLNISLDIDKNYMLKNSEKIDLDQPAYIKNSRTMVPLRAISEADGASVEWIASTRRVVMKTLEEDQGDPKPDIKDEEILDPTKDKMVFLENKSKKIELDMAEKDLRKIMGEPDRIGKGLANRDRYVYGLTDPENHIIFELENGRLVAVRSSGDNWFLEGKLSPRGIYNPFVIGIINQDYKDSGIRAEFLGAKDTKFSRYMLLDWSRPETRVHSSASIEELEMEVFDYINLERARKGLEPLILDRDLSNLARSYSSYIARTGDYSLSGDKKAFRDEAMKFAREKSYTELIELLHRGQGAEEISNGLLDSQFGELNLMTKRYNYIGLAFNEKGHMVIKLGEKE